MAHEIETNGTEAAFVSARMDAWHRLGTVLPDVFTAEEALKIAHLADWDVRKVPAFAELSSGQHVRMPGQYATVRTNPFSGATDILGSVGESYQPVQNEDHCDILNTLVDESGAHFETAGSLREGRNVFVTMKLPNTMTVAGTDQLDLYIAGLNSHDGTSAFQLIVTPVRIVCANTQAYALREANSRYSIRHTSGAKGKIAEARKALGLTFAYLEEFQAEAERMLDTTMTEIQFFDIVEQLWPVDDDSKRGQTIAHERSGQLVHLFADADTQANIRGSRWAGLQAVTEYLDHYAPVQSKGGDVELVRAERVLIGSQLRSQSVRQRAFEAFAVN